MDKVDRFRHLTAMLLEVEPRVHKTPFLKAASYNESD